MSVRLDHGEDILTEVHEINVTPFIDVMLVLLIIFMVAAPLATVDIQVNLPASTAEPQQRPDKPLYLTVKSDLTLALGNDPVGRELLGGTLDAATKAEKDTRIFLRADKTVPYGEVMEVMNLLRTAGYLKVALVSMEKVSGPWGRWPWKMALACGAGSSAARLWCSPTALSPRQCCLGTKRASPTSLPLPSWWTFHRCRSPLRLWRRISRPARSR